MGTWEARCFCLSGGCTTIRVLPRFVHQSLPYVLLFGLLCGHTIPTTYAHGRTKTKPSVQERLSWKWTKQCTVNGAGRFFLKCVYEIMHFEAIVSFKSRGYLAFWGKVGGGFLNHYAFLSNHHSVLRRTIEFLRQIWNSVSWCHSILLLLLSGKIAVAQAILPIATHSFVTWSVVCHIRAPFDELRCHLAFKVVGSKHTFGESRTEPPGHNLLGQNPLFHRGRTEPTPL